MRPLNFPPAELKTKNSENGRLIYDIIRKKYIALTPEEWVRQNCLYYLINTQKYRASFTKVEYTHRLAGLTKRADILVFDTLMKPFLLVECKAPEVAITQKTLDQVNRYNSVLKAPYIFLTNGVQHFCYGVDSVTKIVRGMKNLPKFEVG